MTASRSASLDFATFRDRPDPKPLELPPDWQQRIADLWAALRTNYPTVGERMS